MGNEIYWSVILSKCIPKINFLIMSHTKVLYTHCGNDTQYYQKKMKHTNNGKQNKTRTKPKRQLIMNLSITVECSFFTSSSSNQRHTG